MRNYIFEEAGEFYLLNNEEAQLVVNRAVLHQNLNMQEFSTKLDRQEALNIQISLDCPHFCADKVDDDILEMLLDILTTHT